MISIIPSDPLLLPSFRHLHLYHRQPRSSDEEDRKVSLQFVLLILMFSPFQPGERNQGEVHRFRLHLNHGVHQDRQEEEETRT